MKSSFTILNSVIILQDCAAVILFAAENATQMALQVIETYHSLEGVKSNLTQVFSTSVASPSYAVRLPLTLPVIVDSGVSVYSMSRRQRLHK